MEWWSDPRIWAAIVIVLQFVFVAAHWLGRKSFATTSDMMAAHKVLQDQIDLQEKEITRSHHRVELLAQTIGTLPNYSDINRLREAIGTLTTSVGKLSADVEGLTSTVERTGNSVDTVQQYLLEMKLKV